MSGNEQIHVRVQTQDDTDEDTAAVPRGPLKAAECLTDRGLSDSARKSVPMA